MGLADCAAASGGEEHVLAAAIWAWNGPRSCIDAEGRIAQVWRKVKVKDHAAEVLNGAKAL